MTPDFRWTAALMGSGAALLAVPGSVYAEQAHPSEAAGQGLLAATGIVHGTAQGALVFLAGLVAFAAVVWLPVSRSSGRGPDAGRYFTRGAWGLFGLLLLAGLADLSLYAVRVSGEPLGFGLFREALFETRTGLLWLVRIGLGLSIAVVVSRQGRPVHWWAATGLGLVLLATLTLQSHAAAVGGALPLLSNWLHVVAAAFWMGGLLGFPLLLLGPLRKTPDGGQARLRRMAVRRFSMVATVAVMVIVVTGIHATLLNVPDATALVGTPYGRALIMKLGLFVLLLAAGVINLMDRGRGPFGRMVGAELVLAVGILLAAGFLTSLPPAGSP